jgi:hypothetical protein
MRSYILAVALAISIGCGSTYHVHPGAAGYASGTPTSVQVAASQWYDDLSATDAVIQQTRAAFLAGKFPATIAPKVHDAFNYLVQSYNAAQAAWLAFNQAATAGNTAGMASVQAAIAGMDSAVQQLNSAKTVVAQ